MKKRLMIGIVRVVYSANRLGPGVVPPQKRWVRTPTRPFLTLSCAFSCSVPPGFFFSFLSVHIYFCPYVYMFAMNFGGIPSLAYKRYYRIVGCTLFAMTLTVGLLIIAWLKVRRYNNFSKHIYTHHHLPEARNRES